MGIRFSVSVLSVLFQQKQSPILFPTQAVKAAILGVYLKLKSEAYVTLIGLVWKVRACVCCICVCVWNCVDTLALSAV